MDDALRHLGLLEDDAIDLDTSALALASPDHPEVEVDPYYDLLTDLTRHLVRAGRNATTAHDEADALRSVLAGRFGFEGDRQTYEHPDNADLIRVIDRRRGLPVSLAILYVAAARRLGWEAEILNTPGHVLARIGPETDPVLIDPFDSGAVVSNPTLLQIVQRVLGPDGVLTSEHLSPMSNRSVLVRLLLNQASRAEARGDLQRALTLYSRMTTIAPDHPQPWWDLARLQVSLGEFPEARASLSAMLEITRDPALRNHICGALDALSGAGR
jgi:regulator of sirC expression with transglutaminase-like and TPR domain